MGPQHPVHATVSLQSSPETVDPEIDFACGNFKLHTVRGPMDDFRAEIEGYVQPVLIVELAQTTAVA